jgi:LysR family hydrogen peroxide-inducible transcriptional activator
MQIHELEALLGVELVERRHGAVLVLTEVGEETARRARSILNATRDLLDFAHRSCRVMSGTLRLGIIPTLAPYVLPRLLPELHRKYPELRLVLRETHTKTLLTELTGGKLDAVMLALPVDEAELEAIRLFHDRFLLAVPAGDPLPETARVTTDDVDRCALLLLEEGHCLRDQMLAFCTEGRNGATTGLGAASLTTIIQLVATGYGVTLVPEVAIDVEVRDERIKLLRFVEPQPGRTIGLVWRRTSPRKDDFICFGQLVTEALKAPAPTRGATVSITAVPAALGDERLVH